MNDMRPDTTRDLNVEKPARDITLLERLQGLNARTESLLHEARTAAIGIETALFQSSTPIGKPAITGTTRPDTGTSAESELGRTEDYIHDLSDLGQFLVALRARIEPSVPRTAREIVDGATGRRGY